MLQLLNLIKKMKTVKMSLANLEGKLSRKEMKVIMAGSGEPATCAKYYCGANSLPCCDPADICDSPSTSGKCVRR